MASFLGQQNGANDAPSTTIASGTRTNTAGKHLAGFVVCQINAPGTISVADTAGNTYTVGATYQHSGQPLYITPFYALDALAATNNVVTVTFQNSTQYRSLVVGEWDAPSGVTLDDTYFVESTTDTLSLSSVLGGGGWIAAGLCPYGTRTFTTAQNERYDPGSYYTGLIDRLEASGGTYGIDATWSAAISGVMVAMAFREPSGVTLTQSRYRWRNDDGSETGATWAAAENANITVAAGTPKRLRVQVQSTGDKPSASYKLQFRKVGDPGWQDVN